MNKNTPPSDITWWTNWKRLTWVSWMEHLFSDARKISGIQGLYNSELQEEISKLLDNLMKSLDVIYINISQSTNTGINIIQIKKLNKDLWGFLYNVFERELYSYTHPFDIATTEELAHIQQSIKKAFGPIIELGSNINVTRDELTLMVRVHVNHHIDKTSISPEAQQLYRVIKHPRSKLRGIHGQGTKIPVTQIIKFKYLDSYTLFYNRFIDSSHSVL